ncbi:MAG: hypothetical protein LBU58_09200 [Clostridiales bacterium]|jgi:beta-galactosidase/beta-glucuronidase|nr:hypothetical protein [Clostridiales bacterium]
MKEIIALHEHWWIRDFDNPAEVGDAAIAEIIAQAPSEAAGWMSVEIPNVVQEILFANGRLSKDVLENGVADDCKWVSDRDWVYRRSFDRPADPGAFYLEFLGLDTVADIFLNGVRLARHTSMFLPCRINVTQFLRESGNELMLYFHRPSKIVDENKKNLPERYVGKIGAGALLRKPHGDFGSHGGVVPYFTPIGVFDGIRLVRADRCELTHVDVDIRLNEDLSEAELRVTLECSGDTENVSPEYRLTGPQGECVSEGAPTPLNAAFPCAALADAPGGGKRNLRFSIAVKDPVLWWPKHYGDQPRYKLSITLRHAGGAGAGEALDTTEKTIGIRKIENVGDMKFRVNGLVVRLWGSCITPMWGVSHRWQEDRGYKVLDYAEKAHMNALRLWGPSQPYNDAFYDRCDELGILIWQEFHTWGTHMPDTPEYTGSVLAEAEAMIRRLKHHPCIFMWCGGNEQIYMADLFDSRAKTRIGHDLIRYTLKDLAARLDPGRYYHVSSPSMGLYANEAVYGDNHGSRASLSFLPGEWHAHFFSEDIRTCIPELKSLRRFIPPEDLWPEGYSDAQPYGTTKPLPEAWMARTINHMEEKAGPYELFYDATDPRSLVYKINAAAVYDNRLTVNRLRQSKPFYNSMAGRACNGYLAWKLETAWPQIYCALIDYYLEPGQTYYGLRRAYAPIHVSVDLEDHVYIWGTNDTAQDFSGDLAIEIFDLETEEMTHKRSFAVGIPAGDSLILKNLDEFGQFKRTSVIRAALQSPGGAPVDEDFQYVKPERKLTFPPAKLTLAQAGERVIRISTDRFARCVELTGDAAGDAFGWHFEDNYFDLMPGQTREIRLLGRHGAGVVRGRAFYSPFTAELAL